MLAPYLLLDATPEFLRETMSQAPLPSVVLPDAIDAATAADLRARLEASELAAYALADRGRYHYSDTLVVDELWEPLGALAASVAEAPVALVRARWIRQRRGDYSLVKDDSYTRPNGRHLELALDLSSGNSGEADIVYVDGTAAVPVPQVGGVMSIVDRRGSTTRYLRPPTIRGVAAGGFDVVRLFLQFQLVTN
ncbi:MAG TPA: hypothetical protein VM261_32575 [Kofleriaceae bacterium]|nr:hypothetical protein [Kofleriaceae bacterium]